MKPRTWRPKRTTIRMPEELSAALKHYCVDAKKTATDVIIESVTAYLKKNRKKAAA